MYLREQERVHTDHTEATRNLHATIQNCVLFTSLMHHVIAQQLSIIGCSLAESTLNTLDHAASLSSSFPVIVLIVSIIMTSADITDNHHVSRDVSESSPLLQNSTEVAVDVF